MGGMYGFGAIPDREDEETAPFHHSWEVRVLAVTLAAGGLGQWNLDMSRHSRERLPAQDYLTFSYYERWLAALTNLLVKHQLLSPAELRTGQPQPISKPDLTPLLAKNVGAAMAKGGPTKRSIATSPRYAVGDLVKTLTHSPNQRVAGGHTRLPRYAFGCKGCILTHHGAHILPDAHAHDFGESPEHLYTVRFSAQALWGTQSPQKNTIHLDLWESYLEPLKEQPRSADVQHSRNSPF